MQRVQSSCLELALSKPVTACQPHTIPTPGRSVAIGLLGKVPHSVSDCQRAVAGPAPLARVGEAGRVLRGVKLTPRWTCGLAPMSLGYAEKLSFREDLGGQLGDPEIFDDEAALTAKALQLAHVTCAPPTAARYRAGLCGAPAAAPCFDLMHCSCPCSGFVTQRVLSSLRALASQPLAASAISAGPMACGRSKSRASRCPSPRPPSLMRCRGETSDRDRAVARRTPP